MACSSRQPSNTSTVLAINHTNNKTERHGVTAMPLTSAKDGLTERSLRGIKWNYLGVAGRIAAQLVAQIALARMLGPDTFGVFATSSLIIGLGSICVEMGLGSAVVQTKIIDDAQIRYAFTIAVTAGAIGSIILFFMAGLIADFFKITQLEIVLQVMSPMFIVGALGIISRALLLREFAFKIIQAGQLFSYIISYLLIGTGLAWYGAGIWSLVAAWYIQCALTNIIYFWQCPHSIKPLLIKHSDQLRNFCIIILLTNIVNWIIENLDNLIIGKMLGATKLGLYSVSYNLVRTPANHLVVSLQTILFPASARAQDNNSGLQRAYLSVIAGVTLIAFPIFITTAVLSSTVIEALFGVRWVAAAPITIPLALAMAVHPMMAVAGPMLAGKGQPGTELKVQFWTALVCIAMLLVTSRISIQAVAWTIFAVYVLRAAWITIAILKTLQVSFRRLFRALQGGILISLFISSMIFLIDKFMRSTGQSVGYILLVEIILALLIALFLVFTIPRQILTSELQLIIDNLARRSSLLNDSFLIHRIRRCNFLK